MAENRLNYGKEISNMGYIAADGLGNGLHCGGAIGKTNMGIIDSIRPSLNNVTWNKLSLYYIEK